MPRVSSKISFVVLPREVRHKEQGLQVRCSGIQSGSFSPAKQPWARYLSRISEVGDLFIRLLER